MDVATLKQRQAEVWSLGDYTDLGRMLEPAAAALCDACAVSAGQEVLDVAAGNGNFALAAAREGAAVVASDLAPRMVELGRQRSQAEGYDIEWVEADVEELPFEDGRFDCVGSVFGAMLAPRPEVAAAELFRVVRPGNTVGMTAWTPGSFMSAMFEVGRSFSPPPEGMPLAIEWGDEDTVRQRFDDLAGSIAFQRETLTWQADSPEAWLEGMDNTAGPQVAAKQALGSEQHEALQQQMLELLGRWNQAGDGTLRIDSEYLIVVARKRG